MPISVNGYGAQFNQFVTFAEQQMQAGKSKAIARADSARPAPSRATPSRPRRATGWASASGASGA